MCPICFELMREPHMTSCGHTFCYQCIARALTSSPLCPRCGSRLALESSRCVFPNFALNDMITRRRAKLRQAAELTAKEGDKKGPKGKAMLAGDILRADVSSMSVPELDELITQLTRKKVRMQEESSFAQRFLLQDFLTQLKESKQKELFDLRKEVDVVEADIGRVGQQMLGQVSSAQQESSMVEKEAELRRLKEIYEEDYREQKRRMHATSFSPFFHLIFFPFCLHSKRD